MPVDEAGNRADILMDPNSTINRANPGRFFEQYFNAASRDACKVILNTLEIPQGTPRYKAETALLRKEESLINNAMDYLIGYYRLAAPEMAKWFDEKNLCMAYEERVQYLSEIAEKGLGIYLPTDQEKSFQESVTEIENSVYKPTYGPVTYTGNSGKKVTTKNPVRIGSLYFIVLEKIADDGTAVASCRTQHHGVIAQLAKSDKYSSPITQQAVRGMGEAEIRIALSNMGARWVAELMDRNNNPYTHKHMVVNLLTNPNPANIDNLVDRREIKFGGAKPLILIKHLLEVSGIRLAYTPFDPNAGPTNFTASDIGDEKESDS